MWPFGILLLITAAFPPAYGYFEPLIAYRRRHLCASASSPGEGSRSQPTSLPWRGSFRPRLEQSWSQQKQPWGADEPQLKAGREAFGRSGGADADGRPGLRRLQESLGEQARLGLPGCGRKRVLGVWLR